MRLCRYLRAGDLQTLDAGCGNGAFAFQAARLGNRVLAISTDPDQIRRGEEFRRFLRLDRDRCRFLVHDIYALDQLGLRFDQIICFETLEHLERDQEVLRLFARVLRPGGLLHLGTPRLDRQPYFGEVLSTVEDGGHVRLGYTREGLERMLAREGFDVVAYDTAVGPLGQSVMNLDRRLAARIRRWGPGFRNVLSASVVLSLWPLTWLDSLLSRRQHLCIYLQARRRNSA